LPKLSRIGSAVGRADRTSRRTGNFARSPGEVVSQHSRQRMVKSAGERAGHEAQAAETVKRSGQALRHRANFARVMKRVGVPRKRLWGR
jgi:ABC-type Fe2+-enterobactin transport system substrate-binding protein